MNKKVLSAILFSALFAGTGTFTSCIDNDEPAGIEQLRGAKAELLRAQAAMELANEAFRMAEVANQELMNEAQRITNQMSQIDLEMKELDLKIKEAKAEQKIQNYLYEKQLKENAIAKLAETFKAEMLKAQAKTVTAQTALDNAIKEAEIAKLALDEKSQALVNGALEAMTTKATAMAEAYKALNFAKVQFNEALTADASTISLSQLQNALLVAQNNVKVAELNVGDSERMLELAKNFDAESWTVQLDSLRADSLKAAEDMAAAQVTLDALYAGAEYQAAEKAYKNAAEKLGMDFTDGKWNSTKKVYDKGEAAEKVTEYTYGENDDSTLFAKLVTAREDSSLAIKGLKEYDKVNKLNTTFKIKAYTSEPVDAALKNFLGNEFGKTGSRLAGYDATKGEFYYKEGTYNEHGYRQDSINYKKAIAANPEAVYNATSVALKSLMVAEGWVNALKAYATDTNGLAWSQVYLDEARKDSAEAQAAFDLAKAEWQVLVDAVNGEATEAPTDSLKKNDKGQIIFNADIATAIADYNEALDSLTAAVTKHNNAIDTLKKYEGVLNQTAYDQHIAATKAQYYLEQYAIEGEEFVPAEKASQWTELKAKLSDEENKPTVKDFSDLLAAGDAGTVDNSVSYKVEQYFKSTPGTDGKETNANYTNLITAATKAGYDAVKADHDGAGEKSTLAAYVKAITDTEEGTQALVETANAEIAEAWSVFKTVYIEYVDFLAHNYGQVVTATNLTVLKDSPEATDSVKIGEGKYITFTETSLSSTINWTAVIEKDFGYKATAYGNKLGTDNKAVNYTSWSNYNTKVEDGVITYTANGTVYGYYAVVGSDISEAEEANLSVTEINKKLSINKLTYKSNTAYGKFFDWIQNEQARLVEVTEEMVKADMEQKTNSNYADYGKLGALMQEKADVELILAQKDADKLVEPLLETIEAQFAALKAEIAANTAIVAVYEKAADDAWTAFEAGEAAVEKALADRDALSAEAEADVDLYEAITKEKKHVIESAEQQLQGLLGQEVEGILTTEKLIAAWESAVANAQTEVENLKLAVAEAEKAIELYEAGEYSQAYKVEYYKINLENAQAAYEAAVKLYELAAAEFNAILEALAK